MPDIIVIGVALPDAEEVRAAAIRAPGAEELLDEKVRMVAALEQIAGQIVPAAPAQLAAGDNEHAGDGRLVKATAIVQSGSWILAHAQA
ncbi:MAG TPA: hypothetical protein VGN60_10040 [Devosia sp.]|jgi:hypothetical protein|nr:hypothetical protein [Devosia sp.]